MSIVRCPQCGNKCEDTHRFCGRCGASLVPEEEGFGLLGPLLWFLNIFPGLARPLVLIVSVLAIALSTVVAGVGVWVTLLGAVISGVFILGFALLMWGTGWVWLLYGYLCFPSEALADLEGYKWTIWILLVLAPIALLFALGR